MLPHSTPGGPSLGRLVDILLALAGLLLAAPVIALAALAVWLDDGSPFFFCQQRVGWRGRSFQLWKLRTMRHLSTGLAVTAGNDARITRVGAILRRWKLDELPQFWNVLKGDMGLVGPRPEVAPYVDPANPLWRAVLDRRPGITDLATLLYRDEERLLAAEPDPERAYRERILPAKLALNLEYQRHRSLRTDLKLLLLTAWYSFTPALPDAAAIRRAVLPK